MLDTTIIGLCSLCYILTIYSCRIFFLSYQKNLQPEGIMILSWYYTQTRTSCSSGTDITTASEEIFSCTQFTYLSCPSKLSLRFLKDCHSGFSVKTRDLINMSVCHILSGRGPEKCYPRRSTLPSQEENLPLPMMSSGRNRNGLEMHKMFSIDIWQMAIWQGYEIQNLCVFNV